jgi:hypothetical protein
VHFIALGALLFTLFHFVGNRSEPQHRDIVVTSGKIDQMVTIFSRTWQRPPIAQELDGLIEDHVREEVLYREAMAMGLDKDDTIVRRRLRQKFEFLMEDVGTVQEPTDRDLQAWLVQNPDKFRLEPKYSFLQIYLNLNRRGDDASADATKLLTRLNDTDEKVDASELGDPTLLPFEFPLSSADVIAQVFGSQFAQQLQKLETGSWYGPLQSSYGLNLVYVRERTEGKLKSLEEMRDQVRYEWMTARQNELMETTYRKLRQKYTIVVEPGQPQRSGPSEAGTTPRHGQGQ